MRLLVIKSWQLIKDTGLLTQHYNNYQALTVSQVTVLLILNKRVQAPSIFTDPTGHDCPDFILRIQDGCQQASLSSVWPQFCPALVSCLET